MQYFLFVQPPLILTTTFPSSTPLTSDEPFTSAVSAMAHTLKTWTAGHHCGGSPYGEHVAGTAVVGKTRLPQG